MSRHARETDLALFAAGDMSLWNWVSIQAHTASCEQCRARVQAYRADREHLKQDALELPAGLNWDRLAAEMTANIRVGLAAGECVAPRGRKRVVAGWWPVAAVAGMVMMLTAAWWLNLPASDTESFSHAMRNLVHPRTVVVDEQPVIEASSGGIELRENGSKLLVSQQGGARPKAVSVSTEGSASARYIDSETDQITITSVMNVQ
jgi:hypothetical protein